LCRDGPSGQARSLLHRHPRTFLLTVSLAPLSLTVTLAPRREGPSQRKRANPACETNFATAERWTLGSSPRVTDGGSVFLLLEAGEPTLPSRYLRSTRLSFITSPSRPDARVHPKGKPQTYAQNQLRKPPQVGPSGQACG